MSQRERGRKAKSKEKEEKEQRVEPGETIEGIDAVGERKEEDLIYVCIRI